MKNQPVLSHPILGFGPEHQVFGYYRRLERVQNFIETNYAGEVGLRAAAQIAAMEYSAFSRFFRQKVGITYSKWITRVRLVKAASLLKESDLTISEVAFRTGFTEVRTFQRAFKKYTNLTPRDFRLIVRPDGEVITGEDFACPLRKG